MFLMSFIVSAVCGSVGGVIHNIINESPITELQKTTITIGHLLVWLGVVLTAYGCVKPQTAEFTIGCVLGFGIAFIVFASAAKPAMTVIEEDSDTDLL